MTRRRSLLPPVYNQEFITAFDEADRELFTGKLILHGEPVRLLWNGQRLNFGETGDRVFLRYAGARSNIDTIGLAEDPKPISTDSEGRYIGPTSLMPEYANERGLLLYTEDIIDVFGEEFARRVLGDRIRDGINYGRYAKLLNDRAGSLEVLDIIGELTQANINARVGRFTKPDPNDKATWTLTEETNPATFRPTGIDIDITSYTNIPVDAKRQAWFNIVIPRYIRYKLVDVRITFSTSAPFSTYYWTTSYTETFIGGGL